MFGLWIQELYDYICEESEKSGFEVRKGHAIIRVFVVPDSTHMLDILQHEFKRTLIQPNSLASFK
jgi:hypothetical protein